MPIHYINILNLELETDDLMELERIASEIMNTVSEYAGKHTKLLGSTNLSEVEIIETFPDQLEMREIRDA